MAISTNENNADLHLHGLQLVEDEEDGCGEKEIGEIIIAASALAIVEEVGYNPAH